MDFSKVISKNKDGKTNWDAIAKAIEGCDETALSYFKTLDDGNGTINNQSASVEGLSEYLKKEGNATGFAAAKTALLNAALNAGIFLVASVAIQGIAKALDDYIHRLDNAKETLQETQSELESVNSEVETTTSKIKELEALDPSSLSITDKEDLQRLREQNEELRIRQQYLNQQEQQDLKKVADLTKEKYGIKYGYSVDDETIGAYKQLYEQPIKQQKPASGYLTGNSSYQSTPYSLRQQNEGLTKTSNSLANLIAQYKYFEEQKVNAIQNEDAENIEKYSTKLEEIAEKLRNDRTELQGFSDDLSATGESSSELDGINYRLDLIDDILLTKGQKLVSFINADDIKEDKEKLVALADSGELTADELSKNFSEVDDYLKKNGLTIEDLISIIKTYKDELSSASDEANIGFNPSTFSETIDNLSSLQSIYDDFYNDVVDKADFTFDISDIESLREAFGGVCDSFDDFERLATSSSTAAEEMQNAFDKLANEYVFGSEVLQGLNVQNREQIITQLELQGIVGASAFITREFAQACDDAESAGINFANATYAEIDAFIQEGQYSEDTKNKIYAYAIQKILANENCLSTVGDIAALEALCTNLGIATESLQLFAKAKTLQERIDNGTSNEYVEKRLEETKQQIKNLASQISITSTGLTNMGQSATNAAKTQDRLSKSAGKATDAIKEQTEALEKQKSALEDTKSEMDELADAIAWFFDGKLDDIDDLIEKLNKANDALEAQQDNLDGILDVIDNVYETEINLIQEKIDALDKANDEEEKAIALEKARAALEEARNRKSIMVYEKNKGFVYKVDDSAVKEAEDNLAELEEEAKSDAIKKALEDQIEALEKYRDMWAEIPNAYEKAMKELATSQLFGPDWKDAILNSDENTIGNFKGDYTGIQSNITSNENQITALEAEKAKIQELKDLWADAVNEYKYSQYEAKLSSFFGSDYEYQLLNNSFAWRLKFVDEYSSVCAQIDALEKQIKELSNQTTTEVTSGSEQATNALNGTSSALNNLHQTASNNQTISKYIWGEEDNTALAYAEQRLGILNTLIEQGAVELIDSRDKLQAFINEYGELENSRIVTEDLKNKTKELNDVYDSTNSYLGSVMSGVSDRLGDVSRYSNEVVTNTQSVSDSMSNLDASIQSINSSKDSLENEADEVVSDLDSTISNATEKLGLLNDAISQLGASKQALENSVNTEITEVDGVISTSQEKVEAINGAVNTLVTSISMLQSAMANLTNELSKLDSITLNNVIGLIGFGTDTGTGSLCGSINGVINAVSGDAGLVAKLAILNGTQLDEIISEFNGEEESLLSSIIAVSNAVYSEDDENCLIFRINSIVNTIANIKLVEDGFKKLETQTVKCQTEVEKLNNQIQSMKDKTVTITIRTVRVGEATGTAFTGRGYATGTALSGKSYASGNWGLSQDEKNALLGELGREILVRNGQYFIIDKPTRMDLKKGDIIFNHEQSKVILDRGKTSNINRLADLGTKKAEQLMTGKSFAFGIDGDALMGILENMKNNPLPISWNIPSNNIDYSKMFSNNSRQITSTELHFHGDLSFPNITSGNDAQKLISELSCLSNKALQRAKKR